MLYNTLCKLTVALISLANAAPIPVPDVAAEPKSISFGSHFRYADSELVSKLEKRDTIVDASFHQTLVTFPLTYAGQEINFVADTGSYSTWALDSSVGGTLCDHDSCIDSTGMKLSGGYRILYVGGFGATGKWSQNKVSIDGGVTSAVNYKVGVATATSGSNGGYSWCGLGYNTANSFTNKQLLDPLKTGGLIDKKVITFEYDTENLDLGSEIMGDARITFGSFNSTDGMRSFDRSATTGMEIGFSSITKGGASASAQGTKNILFDTGTTNFEAKAKYISVIKDSFSNDADYPSFFKCSTYKDTVIDFELESGSTLSIPLLNMSWNYYQEDYDLCQLMLTTLSDSYGYEMVFGQYIMKNLVTSIDVEDNTISIAPNSNSSWK